MLMLVVMSGLPAVGKSTLAEELGRRLPACVVSVDPVEDAMLRAGLPQSFETGVAAYEVCGTIAARQLTLGFNVVADAVNDLEIARATWRRAASSARATLRVVHVICGDEDLHRRRLTRRERGLSHYPEPTWTDVEHRRLETELWSEEHLIVDSFEPLDENVRACLRYLRG